MARKKLFVGFSTLAPKSSRSWVLYDIELIKQDLLYQFHTRIGERRMRPTYGCSIWNYIGEQMTDDVIQACEREVERIVSLDTRCEVRSVNVTASRNGIVIFADLYFRPFDVVDSFRIAFEARQ